MVRKVTRCERPFEVRWRSHSWVWWRVVGRFRDRGSPSSWESILFKYLGFYWFCLKLLYCQTCKARKYLLFGILDVCFRATVHVAVRHKYRHVGMWLRKKIYREWIRPIGETTLKKRALNSTSWVVWNRVPQPRADIWDALLSALLLENKRPICQTVGFSLPYKFNNRQFSRTCYPPRKKCDNPFVALPSQ